MSNKGKILTEAGALVDVDDLGGSQTVIGTSWIQVDGSAQAGLAMGTAHLAAYTLTDSLGADLSLNADTKHVDIATAGWYAITAFVGILGAANQVQITLRYALAAWGDRDVYESCDPTLGAYDTYIGAACVGLTAGDQVSVNCFADNATSTGTYTIEGQPTGMLVVRMA